MEASGFRWNDWNLDHIARHGVAAEEAEQVIADARRPYPEYVGGGKWRVRGRSHSGRGLQVIFVVEDDLIYVIHSRPLTDVERRKLNRSLR